jgi:hypothetical protein
LAAGDTNGDSTDDLLIGAIGFDATGASDSENHVAVYLVLGHSGL